MPLKIRLLTLCLLGALVVPTATLAQSVTSGVSFETARAMMHERADRLKMTAAEVEQKTHQVKEAKSLSGPKVTLNAKQVEGRKNLNMEFDNPLGEINIPPLGPNIPGLNIPGTLEIDYEDDLSGPRASVDLTWPIYTGGAISAQQEASRAALRQAQAGHDKSREEMDALLVQKYFGVQLARHIEQLRNDLYKQKGRDLARAKRFEKVGMIAKIERMNAEVNLDTAERELVQSQTDLKVAERELSELLREPVPAQLSTPIFVLSDLKTLALWQNLAQAHSPVLREIESQREQALMGVKAAKSSFHPQVYLFGQYNFIDHYLTITEPDWIAGIGVTFTLWDNRDRSARVGSAHALVDKASAAQSQAKHELDKAVEIAWLRSQEALEQFELTTNAIELAKENVRLHERSFSEGLATVDDLNDARNKLIAAQVARSVAAYRFVVAYSLLHASSGQMVSFADAFNNPKTVFVTP